MEGTDSVVTCKRCDLCVLNEVRSYRQDDLVTLHTGWSPTLRIAVG